MTEPKDIVVTEVPAKTNDPNCISSPILDGFHLTKFKENMLSEENEETVNFILSNAYQSIDKFKNPIDSPNPDPIKILCLGKVQSGKTSFFLASTALAFDNGYDIAYIIGGTKVKLKEQNHMRIIDSFKNNEKIRVFDLNDKIKEDIPSLISQGFKIVFIVLKNPAEHRNLGRLKLFVQEYSSFPTVVIDDEGDEYTPGAPKAKAKNKSGGATHDKIVDVIKGFKTCTYLSVTATPQANLLLSIYDEISPDRLVLVKPGHGYTGGHEFFDSKDNNHITVIQDKDDFIDSIPYSFKDAMVFFIFSCALKRTLGDKKPFSMLIHPSSLNKVQNEVAMRIVNFYNNYIIPASINENSIEMEDLITSLKISYNEYLSINGDVPSSFESTLEEVKNVIDKLGILLVNSNAKYENKTGDKTKIYNLVIGGNMLGRGLTIERLIVSYIYRDTKLSQVDTMYQQCRWFGYKRKYFDVCKVYMTKELQGKFMAIVSSEDHLWSSLESFQESQVDLKKFKRLFKIEHNNLLLTRKSVSNTVVEEYISFGTRSDESIDIDKELKVQNRNLYFDYLNKHEHEGALVDFDNSINHRQRHLLIKTSLKTLYDEFLSKLNYGYGSPFSTRLFQAVIESRKGTKDEILVMIMRYKIGEHRSPNSLQTSIANLLQGRNDGTLFTGDRYPIDINGNDYSSIPFIQIHMVDINNKQPNIEECIPLLSYNNPYTSEIIKLVTGDNDYE